jgi:hypothetical protein
MALVPADTVLRPRPAAGAEGFPGFTNGPFPVHTRVVGLGKPRSRARPGTASRNSRVIGDFEGVRGRPVDVAPGRARLATNPLSTGADAYIMTIGAADVARFSAATSGLVNPAARPGRKPPTRKPGQAARRRRRSPSDARRRDSPLVVSEELQPHRRLCADIHEREIAQTPDLGSCRLRALSPAARSRRPRRGPCARRHSCSSELPATQSKASLR